MANRISVLIDVATDKAVGAIGNFRKALNDAETNGTSKFKAGANQAFASVQENAGALALSAGTALIGFGVHAVGAFTDAAKAAIDFGAATGLATEDASRWIAVGDDFGVAADQLSSGVGKIAKSLDDSKWAKYGIETRDAAGNARNANDILLDSFARLSDITNATERARVGNELFGKGYANLAPLIGHTRKEYEEMLGAVEAGQVITAEEAEKAERMRLAQDALSDALNEVTLAVGGFVAELSPMIEGAAGAVTKITELTGKVDGLSTAFLVATGNPMAAWDAVQSRGAKAVDLHGLSLDELNAKLEKAGATTEQVKSITDEWRTANGIAAEDVDKAAAASDNQALAVAGATVALAAQKGAAEEAKTANENYNAAVKDSTDAIEDARKAEKDRLDAINDTRDALRKGIDAEYDYMQSARDTAAALDDYTAKTKDNSLSSRDLASATEDMRRRMVDTAQAMADAGGAAQGSKGYIDDMIASLYTQMSTLEPGSPLYQAIGGYIAQLQTLPGEMNTDLTLNTDDALAEIAVIKGQLDIATAPRTVRIGYSTAGRVDSALPNVHGATGGVVTRPTVALIGEDGPEAVVPLNRTPGSRPLAEAGVAGGNTFNVTINALGDGRSTLQELRLWSALYGRAA